jgi:hypothetical protein
MEDGVTTNSSDELESQTVSTYLAIIRKYLLRDRTLHDMVLPYIFSNLSV